MIYLKEFFFEVKIRINMSLCNIYNINRNFKVIFLIFLVFNKFFKFNKKDKKKFICLCVIGKNENLYAKEYINYYKNLGYNHIFIYDNNDINGERFSDILHSEIENGFVSIIDFIGYKSNSNSAQIEAYYDCYKKNNRNYN